MKITGEDGVTRVYAIHKGILKIMSSYRESTITRTLDWIVGPPLMFTDFIMWD